MIIGQIDLFRNHSYSGTTKKKTLEETTAQKCKYEWTMTAIPKPVGIK